jgi:segregation and condensation protein A
VVDLVHGGVDKNNFCALTRRAGSGFFLFFEMPAMQTVADVFEIKLPQFEGPFDLLLFFIERDELNIHDIPISRITNDFLEYIHRAEQMNIELACEFILVASTLMRIKAKMLLPRYTTDEEGNEIDPREDLVARLLEYKQYKDATTELQDKEAERTRRFERGNTAAELSDIALYADGSTYNAELNNLTLYKLIMTYEKIMERFKREEETRHTVVRYPYSQETEKANLLALLKTKPTLSFGDVFSRCLNRVHVVYVFLSVLELIQSRQVFLFLSGGFNNFFLSDAEPRPEQVN